MVPLEAGFPPYCHPPWNPAAVSFHDRRMKHASINRWLYSISTLLFSSNTQNRSVLRKGKVAVLGSPFASDDAEAMLLPHAGEINARRNIGNPRLFLTNILCGDIQAKCDVNKYYFDDVCRFLTVLMEPEISLRQYQGAFLIAGLLTCPENSAFSAYFVRGVAYGYGDI